MLKYVVLAITLCLTLAPFTSHASSSKTVGTATEITGIVEIIRADATAPSPLQQGENIAQQDKILTQDDNSFVRIEFLDKTNITLRGEDGELTIDEYVYTPEESDKNTAEFSILRGSFEFVGGLIENKTDAENVRLNLDFGSIGIRGTHIYRAMRDEECWIFLEDGEIRVFNDGGEVVLAPGDGTRMSANDKAPIEAKPWGQKNIDWIKSETASPAQ